MAFLQSLRRPRADDSPPPTKQEEWRTFLFLTIFTAPMVAVMVVGGYGFAVWIFQLFTGRLPNG